MKQRLRTIKSLSLLSYLNNMMPFKCVAGAWTLSLLCMLSVSATAGSLEQAKQLHDRIAGVAASQATIENMAALLDDGKPIEAAYLAMETPAFYSTTLKLFATPWTNIDQDIFAPLNDYSATVIGAVRDDVDFREILQADMVYVGKNSLNLPAYNRNNNDHYQALEDQFIDLKEGLERTTQSSLNGLPSSATAGVLTSRAAAKEFFYLGTNRAMFRFTLMNHLCTDLEPLKDNTRPTDRIRQDVSRSPGGDSRLFINNCSSCHSGMDPLAQAFAYYQYEFNLDQDPSGENGAIVYNTSGQTDPDTGTRVQGKYHINASSFPYGFVTPNDDWQNYWREGPNQKLGWDSGLPGQGSGAKSLGQELANSNAFAQCQVKKVFKSVCLRDAESQADIAQINATTASFKQNAYQLKRVFAEVGNYCMGE
ncbi:hypothetical protein L2703_03260 [Shewanella basaltis]|jgi:hypothetical protein|uniref:hypothetical protein n=1 Tax=Shewanella basaltis TaxID=472183 RepID=UPI00200C6443|nr:hypothetical protein [Shewanella basaltis]MCL1112630.1 hypothetical protein [Shewanella basaltis]